MTFINSRYDRGKLLTQAIEQNEVHLVRKLIIEEGVQLVGIDPEQSSYKKFLKLAVGFGDASVVKELLKLKPNLNMLEGSQILQTVLDDGDTEIVSMLIHAGVRLVPSNVTRLVWNRSKKKAELALVMLDHRIHVHECAGALQAAKRSHSLDFADEFLRRGAAHNDAEAKINMNKRIWEAFCEAAFFGQIDAIKLLMKYGFDVTKKSCTGVYPVYIAAGAKKSVATEFLIENGANIHQANGDAVGRYPIHRACVRSSHQNIKLLLSLGVVVTVVDKLGCTPFSLLNHAPYINGTQRIFIRRLVLEIAKTNGSVNNDLIKKSVEQQNFFRECTIELRKMQDRTIEVQKMKVLNHSSFLNIFNFNIKELNYLVTNSNFVDNYRDMCQKGQLFLFTVDMNEKLESATGRKNSLATIEKALCEAIHEFIPETIMEKIVYYLCLLDV